MDKKFKKRLEFVKDNSKNIVYWGGKKMVRILI